MTTAINTATTGEHELNEAELDAVSGGIPSTGWENEWWAQFVCWSCPP